MPALRRLGHPSRSYRSSSSKTLQIAAAQLRLKGFLSPMATRNLDMPYRLAAATVNIVARNQTVLLNSLRDRVAESPDLVDELARVENLVDLFRDAIHTIRGLHDNTGPRGQPRLRAQQQEISVAVRHGHIGLLSDRQVTHLLAATEATLATWAAAVRREGLRHRHQLPGRAPRHHRQPHLRAHQRERPGRYAVSALAEVTPPVPEPVEVIPTRGRDSLRSTLAQASQYETTADWPGPGRRHEHRAPSTRRPASPGQRR